jgi:hypothetical protein
LRVSAVVLRLNIEEDGRGATNVAGRAAGHDIPSRAARKAPGAGMRERRLSRVGSRSDRSKSVAEYSYGGCVMRGMVLG